MPLLKTHANWGGLIRAPNNGSVRGAVCMTCGRLVDYEGIDLNFSEPVDLEKGRPATKPYAQYLVKHHGAEELRTFDMGSTNWDIADVQQMAVRTNWFDPTAHEGIGAGVRVKNIGEHDDKSDGEFKVISDLGASRPVADDGSQATRDVLTLLNGRR